ncbi:protein kinase [Nocardiopsis sp. MG754419]|uniref:protein kinase domain-containing protein n=1 Tax=Nocardiopsis sp. MG754419 TaxID=2259865 RepID=UPI0027DE24DA|nr:protein kinase [Nocardiopsis sp. MG754419]
MRGSPARCAPPNACAARSPRRSWTPIPRRPRRGWPPSTCPDRPSRRPCGTKPSNILLSPRGPQVIDFGIARAVEGTVLTRTGQNFGTPAYTSPEQIIGGNVTPRADVFSLGGAVVFAASGMPPFGAGVAVNSLARVLKAEPNLDALPEGPLRDLIARCMAKDPEERPDTDAILSALSGLPLPSAEHGWLPTQVHRQIDARAGATARAGAAEPATAPPGGAHTAEGSAEPPRPRPAPAWWRRRSALVATAAVAALVLLGGGALAWSALPADSEDAPDPTADGAAEGESAEGGGDEDDAGAEEEFGPFDGFVYDLTFSEDGDLLHAFGSGTLSTWDWRSGERVDEYPLATGAHFTGTGHLASTVHDYVRVWEGDSENRIAVLGRDEEFGVFDMPALTADGSTLAVQASDDGTLEGDPILVTWDLESGEVVSDFPIDGFLHELAYTPDESTLVGATYAADAQTTVAALVWDARTGEELHRFESEGSVDVALSADGDTMVVLSDSTEVFVVDLADGSTRDMDVPDLGYSRLNEVALSPDGSIAYSGRNMPDEDSLVWDTDSGELLPAEGLRLSDVIGIAPDGEHFATTHSEGGTTFVRVLDATDHSVVAEFS